MNEREVIDKLHVTGEGQPSGKGPAQNLVQSQGNKYLDEKYPELSYIKSAKILNDFGSKNKDVAQKEKSLRGDVDEKPKEKKKLDLDRTFMYLKITLVQIISMMMV